MLPSDLTDFQNHIRSTISEGDIQQALVDLLKWSQTYNPDLYKEVLMLSNEFKKIYNDDLNGITSTQKSNIDYTHIKDSLLKITDRIEKKSPSTLVLLKKKLKKILLFLKKHWKKFSIPAILAILGSIAEFSGYNLHEIFSKKTKPIEQIDTLEDILPTTEQTTSGPNSPAIKTESGDVYIEYEDNNWENAAIENTKKDTIK